MAKAYLTVSNEALCIINGITPIKIKMQELGNLYEILNGDEPIIIRKWKKKTGTTRHFMLK